jgi:hypothetical protein
VLKRAAGRQNAGDRVRAIFVGARWWRRLSFFVLRTYGSPANMAPYFCVARAAEAEAEAEAEVAFFCVAHMGVPRSWHPILVFAFLRCAHMGVPRSWHPIFALLAHVLEATTQSMLGWDTCRYSKVWSFHTQLKD